MYKYLVDNNGTYEYYLTYDSIEQMVTLILCSYIGLVFGLLGYFMLWKKGARFMGVTISLGGLILIVLFSNSAYEEYRDRKNFSIEDYQNTFVKFNTTLDKQMTAKETELKIEELTSTELDIVERIGEIDSNIYDVVIKTESGKHIKRLKIINTKDVTLDGIYRELPDDLNLTLKPFSGYEGYLFVLKGTELSK